MASRDLRATSGAPSGASIAPLTPDLGVAEFGHHPDPEIDFGIEVDALIGEGYEVCVHIVSQWPFWARLRRALRLGRLNEWFGQPHLGSVLQGLEPAVCAMDRNAVLALGNDPGRAIAGRDPRGAPDAEVSPGTNPESLGDQR